MMAVRVFIGLGSNLGEPLKQLASAVQAMGQIAQTDLKNVSSVYLSRPMGPQDQADYLNAVVELETSLSAEELLSQLQLIETQQGRVRDGVRWQARHLDLDILLYGDAHINTPLLTVPHQGLHERAFVLYPLQELDASLHIPGKGDLADLMKQSLTGEVLEKLDVSLCP